MEITCRYIGLIPFAFRFGLKYAPKEVLRIAARTVLERKRNKIIVAVVKESGKEKIAGYCVARPAPKKYCFATPTDYIMGPDLVLPEYRGQKIGRTMLQIISDDIQKSGGNAYGYLCLSNLPSQHHMAACGYRNAGYMKKNDDGTFSLTQEKTDLFIFARDGEKS